MKDQIYIRTNIIPKITALLHSEGVTVDNYDYNRVVEILRKTVRPSALISILNEYEFEIRMKL